MRDLKPQHSHGGLADEGDRCPVWPLENTPQWNGEDGD